MKYNTEEKKLVMPEYGRNIQNMVDYCITIQDREERKRCADTIINIMGNMFPHLRDVNDFKHILWVTWLLWPTSNWISIIRTRS